MVRTPTDAAVLEAGTLPPPRREAARPAVYFEYQGRSALTVLGPITGQRYRFPSPGARLAVDGRDAPSLNAVPNLSRVRTELNA